MSHLDAGSLSRPLGQENCSCVYIEDKHVISQCSIIMLQERYHVYESAAEL